VYRSRRNLRPQSVQGLLPPRRLRGGGVDYASSRASAACWRWQTLSTPTKKPRITK
jgi:hypothetical protein